MTFLAKLFTLCALDALISRRIGLNRLPLLDSWPQFKHLPPGETEPWKQSRFCLRWVPTLSPYPQFVFDNAWAFWRQWGELIKHLKLPLIRSNPTNTVEGLIIWIHFISGEYWLMSQQPVAELTPESASGWPLRGLISLRLFDLFVHLRLSVLLMS